MTLSRVWQHLADNSSGQFRMWCYLISLITHRSQNWFNLTFKKLCCLSDVIYVAVPLLGNPTATVLLVGKLTITRTTIHSVYFGWFFVCFVFSSPLYKIQWSTCPINLYNSFVILIELFNCFWDEWRILTLLKQDFKRGFNFLIVKGPCC